MSYHLKFFLFSPCDALAMFLAVLAIFLPVLANVLVRSCLFLRRSCPFLRTFLPVLAMFLPVLAMFLPLLESAHLGKSLPRQRRKQRRVRHAHCRKRPRRMESQCPARWSRPGAARPSVPTPPTTVHRAGSPSQTPTPSWRGPVRQSRPDAAPPPSPMPQTTAHRASLFVN